MRASWAHSGYLSRRLLVHGSDAGGRPGDLRKVCPQRRADGEIVSDRKDLAGIRENQGWQLTASI